MYLVALSSLPAASGANNNDEREASPTTTTYDTVLIDLSKVTTIRSDGTSDANQPAYLCGYDLARENRGDCGNAYNVDIAPVNDGTSLRHRTLTWATSIFSPSRILESLTSLMLRLRFAFGHLSDWNAALL